MLDWNTIPAARITDMTETLTPPAKKRFLAQTVFENRQMLAQLPPHPSPDTYDFALRLNEIPSSIKALEQKDWKWFAETLGGLGYALYGRALYSTHLDPRASGWGEMWQVPATIYPRTPTIGDMVLVNDAIGRRAELGVGVLTSIDAEPVPSRRAKHHEDGGPLSQHQRFNLTLLDGRPMAWTNASITTIATARLYQMLREIAERNRERDRDRGVAMGMGRAVIRF